MKLLFLSLVFALGSGLGQFLLKQISINVSASKYITADNLFAAILLVFILVLCQGFYLYILHDIKVNVAYPVTIGSSFLGVTVMSLLFLNEQLKPSVFLGSVLVLSGHIISKG